MKKLVEYLLADVGNLALWLAVIATVIGLMMPAHAGQFRNYYGANGNVIGSSNTPGGGKFTNFYDRNGRYVGTEVRQRRR